MEPLTATLVMFAVVTLAMSWILLIINASEDDFTWGLCSVFLPPLAYFYGLFRWEKASGAIKLAVIGLILLWLGLA